MKYRVVLNERNMSVRISQGKKVLARGVDVGFNASDLDADSALVSSDDNLFLFLTVSDRPLVHAAKMTMIGDAAWIHPVGLRYSAEDAVIEDGQHRPRIDVCEDWLRKLWGRIPRAFWLRVEVE
jgi:hypothetical protein